MFRRSANKIGVALALASIFVLGGLPKAFAGKSVDEVKEIQARNEQSVFQVPGVVGVGIGADESGEPIFNIYVKAEAATESVPNTIEDVPVALILSAEFQAYDTCNPRPAPCAHRNVFGFPVPGGISISNHLTCTSNTGTRAFRVCDAGDINNIGFLTNNHIAARGPDHCPNGAPIGTSVFQPGTDDVACGSGNDIGNLDRYGFIDPGGNNVIDAAFVRSDPGRVSDNIWDIGSPSFSPRTPNVGETVKKSGSTTGFTQGTVQSTNYSGFVGYCFSAFFVNQIVVTPGNFSAGGDSGSPVLDASNNPVGLLFAGNGFQTIVNPITEVLSRLNLRFDCTPVFPGPDINLKASSGQYVTAEGGGGGVVNANRDAAFAWETFRLHDLDGGDLASGHRVTFRTNDGHFLQAEGGGNARMLAIGLIEGPWETFVIERTAGPGIIQSGDAVSLRTAEGPWYTVAEGGGGGGVNVNRLAVGLWETFTFIR